MSLIHMDVSSVRRVQHGLEEIQSAMSENLHPLKRVNQHIQTDWISNSAREYAGLFSEVETRLWEIARHLDDLADGLSAEIAKYEQIDQELG